MTDGCVACGACCRYLCLEIPSDHHGFYHWLWLHGGEVCKVAGRTVVKLQIRCEKLGPHGKCTIYEERPEMCRLAYCEDAAKAQGGEIVWLEGED